MLMKNLNTYILPGILRKLQNRYKELQS